MLTTPRSPDSLTVFETLETAFWWLDVGPAPLKIHGRRFPDLPNRALSLHQLRVRLASTTVGQDSRAAIWSYLVRQARTPRPRQADWTIGAAALALPELVRIVGALTRHHHAPRRDRPLDLRADLEAAALGGFLAELRRVDLDDTGDRRIRWRLLMAAYRAARTLRDTTHPARTTAPRTPPPAQREAQR